MPAPPSTGSSPTLCVRAATSPTTTAPAASPFTATSLRMRTLPSSTLAPEFCPWPTLVPTPTAPSSLSARRRPRGWTQARCFRPGRRGHGCREEVGEHGLPERENQVQHQGHRLRSAQLVPFYPAASTSSALRSIKQKI